MVLAGSKMREGVTDAEIQAWHEEWATAMAASTAADEQAEKLAVLTAELDAAAAARAETRVALNATEASLARLVMDKAAARAALSDQTARREAAEANASETASALDEASSARDELQAECERLTGLNKQICAAAAHGGLDLRSIAHGHRKDSLVARLFRLPLRLLAPAGAATSSRIVTIKEEAEHSPFELEMLEAIEHNRSATEGDAATRRRNKARIAKLKVM